MQMLELAKRGYEKPAWLTPNEFARVIPESPVAALVGEFTTLYQDLRYGGRASAGERMLGLLQEIEAVGSGTAKSEGSRTFAFLHASQTRKLLPNVP